jgi:predicted nucleotide-binding protein
MAKNVSNTNSSERTSLERPHEEVKQLIQGRISKGEAIILSINSEETLAKARNDFQVWDEFNKELLSQLFSSTIKSDQYCVSVNKPTVRGIAIGRPTPFSEKVSNFRRFISPKINFLKATLETIDIIPLTNQLTPKSSNSRRSVSESHSKNKVFIVHGRDEKFKQEICRLLEKLDLEVIVLHERASQGRTIIEKLEYYSDVEFAIVLFTPDDLGGLADQNPSGFEKRARQNVVFELGYLMGKLGRENTCVLLHQLEPPSDIDGVVYISLGNQNWQIEMAKEMKAAGIDIDMNKLF